MRAFPVRACYELPVPIDRGSCAVTTQDVPMPKFAILVGGFLPRDEKFADVIRESRPQVPSLFVMGEADALVPPQRCVITIHGPCLGAHIPQTSVFGQTWALFSLQWSIFGQARVP